MVDYKSKIMAITHRGKHPTIYFARPQSCYAVNGCTIDGLCMDVLRAMGFHVVDPGSPEVSSLFEQYKKDNPENYMTFFKMVCDNCDALAMMPFPDDHQAEGIPNVPRRIGAGVWYEAQSVFDRNGSVYLIEYLGKDHPSGNEIPCTRVRNFDAVTTLSRKQTLALLALTMARYRN